MLARSRTFFDLFLDGKASAEDVDDHIDAWHDSADDEVRSLAAFLGLSEDEHEVWLTDGRTLPLIARSRQADGPSLQALVAERVRQMQADLRPEDRGALSAMQHWLSAKGG